MASPILDTTFGTGFNSSGWVNGTTWNTGAHTQQAGGANEVFIAVVCYENNTSSGGPPSIASITESSSTLTFTKVGSINNTSGGNGPRIEIWSASDSGTFNSGGSALTWTVNFNSDNDGHVDDACINVFAFSGVHSISSPFDSNASFPASAKNSTSTTPPSVSFTTDEADDLLIGVVARGNCCGGQATPSGWTNAANNGTAAGFNGMVVGIDYKSVSSAGASSYQNAGTTNDYWVSMVIALTADASSSGPHGTWASTEAKDTMSAAGYGPPPSGTWASTEAKDTLLFNEGVHGTWHSTEATDAMNFDGHPIGQLFIDARATGEAGDPTSAGISTGTCTISTNNPDDIIVLAITTGGFWHDGGVATVTDSAGLVWKRRSTRHKETVHMDLWWAHAPHVLSADVITVTSDSLTGAFAISAVAIGNANVEAPWDTNVLANSFSINQPYGEPNTANISTNASATMLLAFYGNAYSTTPTAYVPLTFLESVVGSEHSGYDFISGLAYDIVSTPQDGTSLGFGAGNALMVDAIVQTGLPGTADEILWYFDGESFNVVGVPIWPSQTLVFTAPNGQLSASITTVNPNEMLVCVVAIQSANGHGEVASVSDSIGLSPGWVRRSRAVTGGGTLALEVWWSWTHQTLSNSDTITVTTANTAAGDSAMMMLFGIGGARGFQTGVWWDGDNSLPDANASVSSGVINVTELSTVNANTLDLMFAVNLDAGDSFNYPPGGNATAPFALGPRQTTSGPTMNLGVLYNYSDSPLSDDMAASSLTPTLWVAIGDAIPVGPAPPPIGVWASTETADKFTHSGDFSAIGIASPGGWVGFPKLTGTFTTTEAKDACTNDGAFAALGWLTGWAGYVPAHGTWASTESKDRLADSGWVIGDPGDPWRGGITGTMNLREAPDRFAGAHVTSVTGTMNLTEAKDRMASAGFLIPKAAPSPPKKRRVLVVT